MKHFPSDFQKVVDFAESELGVDVKLGQTTSFMGHFAKRIFIHHNFNLEKNGLFALLHEVGHALQPQEYVGPNHYKNIDMDEKPREFAMHRFYNEQDAWVKGENLAKELGIEIDMKSWNDTKDEALLTYFTTN